MPPDAPVRTFEDLVAGRERAHVVWRDERHLAFLAPRPVRRGHVIVLPREVSPYLFDLAPEAHAALWEAARVVARTMRERLPCERVCVAVVGWEVRHVHVHLVPTDASGQFPPLGGEPASEAELAELQRRLASGSTPPRAGG